MWGLSQALLLLLLLSFSFAQTDPLRSQIVGGHEAKPHSRPYMAALRYRYGVFRCGGFLVAPQWVMTAAHCKSTYSVTLGAHNIRKKETSQQEFTVKESHEHHSYNNKTFSNDIRLLKLNSKATLNEYVTTLRLPTRDRDLSDGTPCSVAGWGRVYEDWSPDTLHEISVAILDRRKCRAVYSNLNNGVVCTGRRDEPEDPYKGDSGGPLVCGGVAQGIVSHGFPCPPGVYTRIAYYIPWIEETMAK